MANFPRMHNENITFSKDYIYCIEKEFDRTPNTLEAWIKLCLNHFGDYSIISSFANGMYPCISFELTKGHPVLLWGDPEFICKYTFDAVNLLTNQWAHLAIVRDYDNKEIRCYVNGELAQTLGMNRAKRELTCGTFSIGGDKRERNSHAFLARLGQLALYHSVRTKEQILCDMDKTVPCDSLIALYDNFRGDRLTDLSGNGYNAVKTVASSSYFVQPDQMPPLDDYDYTFAVLGDIQTLTEDYPEYLHLVYDWLLKNKDEQKIAYVLGLGDTTSWPSESTWEFAMKSVLRLKNRIPFTFARGNHDTVEQFNKYFPYSLHKDTVDGTFDQTMINAYKAFTIGKRKFLLFILDFGPAMEILDWASQIIQAHPDHNVIITTHSYIFRDGNLHDATYPYPPHLFGGVLNGDAIWEHLIRKHKNIVLVLCGHISSETVVLRHDIGDHGNLITTLLVNPQDTDTWFEGLGMVATLHFSHNDNTVQVRHYSVIKDKYFSASAQYRFKLDFVNEN